MSYSYSPYYNNRILAKLDALSKRVGDCIVWIGHTCGNSDRGRVRYKGKMVTVARLVMHLKCGFDLESDDFILHKVECVNPNCINTEHLYVGDRSQNEQDRRDIREIGVSKT